MYIVLSAAHILSQKVISTNSRSTELQISTNPKLFFSIRTDRARPKGATDAIEYILTVETSDPERKLEITSWPKNIMKR